MIDLSFRLESELFSLTLKEHADSRFMIKSDGRSRTLLCPEGTDFKSRRIQTWLVKVVQELIRKQAKLLLPKRLHQLAEQHGFNFNRVVIKNMRTRWGSCSSLGNINLSCYLVLLPSHLADYVMLHELCHTREMNHGPHFWELLNSLTDGKAKALRAEIRTFKSAV